MLKKMTMMFFSASLGLMWMPSFASAQGATTSTTTVDSVTTKTPVAPVRRSRHVHHSTQPAAKVEETTEVTSTTTVTPPPPPAQKEVIHKVYSEEMLKKMDKTLCTAGFKAYVGLDKKNVCASQATAPDFAFSCVWDKDGAAAFAPTAQGPCNLDYAEHHGSVTIKKELYKDDPPLDYGKEAQCCLRPAKGYETATK